MPKNWLKPMPALLDGVVGSSAMATPPVLAPIDRAPLAKPIVPMPVSAVVIVLRNVGAAAGGGAQAVGGPPLTLTLKLSKSMATRFWMTPALSMKARVVLPVK